MSDRQRYLKMPNPYPTNHYYIRSALNQHHREIGELQTQIEELRELLAEHTPGSPE